MPNEGGAYMFECEGQVVAIATTGSCSGTGGVRSRWTSRMGRSGVCLSGALLIALANSDASANAMTEEAIEKAHHAVHELLS